MSDESRPASNENLGASTAYDTMKAMYLQADPRLKGNPRAYIALTDAMFDNYMFYLAEKQISFNAEPTLEGGSVIKNSFFGIDVIKRNDWSPQQSAAFLVPTRLILDDNVFLWLLKFV